MQKKEIKNSYKDSAEILKVLPIKEMIQFGWISKKESISELVIECLKYFGVSSFKTWNHSYKESILAFRTTTKVKHQSGSVAAWLRYGERVAENKNLPKYNSQVLKKKLIDLKKLSIERDPKIFLPQIEKILIECGIVFIVEPTPKGCPVSGLTKWISKNNVLIMQSFRYKSNDHFWFTFFHEIGHVLLHKKKMIYLEMNTQITNHEEKQADQFASDFLIPADTFIDIIQDSINEKTISNYSKKLGIAPGILIGRLQKEKKIPWESRMNSLKIFYKWKK